MSTVWKPAEFEIATGDGVLRVTGEVQAPFGVQRNGTAWVVTHLPTGGRLPCLFVSLGAAKQAVSEIVAFGDWSFDGIGDVRSFSRAGFWRGRS